MNVNQSYLDQLKKPLLFTTIGLFGVSALLGIFFILVAETRSSESWRVLTTTTLLSFFSLLSMNNILRLGAKPPASLFAATGLLSNIIWVSFALYIVWSTWSSTHEFVWRTIWVTTLLSICVTLTANYISMKNTSQALLALKFSALGSAWFLYVFILPVILGAESSYLSDSWQLIAIVSIVFAFSAISTPILYKIQSGKLKDEPQIDTSSVTNSDELRAQIEAELRPKIEAEIRAQIEAEQRNNTGQ